MMYQTKFVWFGASQKKYSWKWSKNLCFGSKIKQNASQKSNELCRIVNTTQSVFFLAFKYNITHNTIIYNCVVLYCTNRNPGGLIWRWKASYIRQKISCFRVFLLSCCLPWYRVITQFPVNWRQLFDWLDTIFYSHIFFMFYTLFQYFVGVLITKLWCNIYAGTRTSMGNMFAVN